MSSEPHNTMPFRKAFPDYDAPLPAVPGLQDESWRNDACPVLRGNGLELWCDYADAGKRAFPDTPRFTLNRYGEDDTTPLAESGSFREIVNVYMRCRIQHMTDDERRVWLGAAYASTVGYDSFEDDPSATAEDVADVLAGVLAEHFEAETAGHGDDAGR